MNGIQDLTLHRETFLSVKVSQRNQKKSIKKHRANLFCHIGIIKKDNLHTRNPSVHLTVNGKVAKWQLQEGFRLLLRPTDLESYIHLIISHYSGPPHLPINSYDARRSNPTSVSHLFIRKVHRNSAQCPLVMSSNIILEHNNLKKLIR